MSYELLICMPFCITSYSTTQRFPCMDRQCDGVRHNLPIAEAGRKKTNRIRIECVWFDIHSQRIAIHLLIGRYWISRMLNNIQPICGDVCVSEWDETCIDRWRFLRTWKVIDKPLLLLLLMMLRCWYWYSIHTLMLTCFSVSVRMQHTFCTIFRSFRFACLHIVCFLTIIASYNDSSNLVLKSKTSTSPDKTAPVTSIL